MKLPMPEEAKVAIEQATQTFEVLTASMQRIEGLLVEILAALRDSDG